MLQHLQERDQLFGHGLEVLRVDQRERELESATLDRDVRVLETLEDRRPVTLHGRAVQRHCPQ